MTTGPLATALDVAAAGFGNQSQDLFVRVLVTALGRLERDVAAVGEEFGTELYHLKFKACQRQVGHHIWLIDSAREDVHAGGRRMEQLPHSVVAVPIGE